MEGRVPKFRDPQRLPKMPPYILHIWHGVNHKQTGRGVPLPHTKGHPGQMPHDTRPHLLSWLLRQTHKPYFSRLRRYHAFFDRQRERSRGRGTGGKERGRGRGRGRSAGGGRDSVARYNKTMHVLRLPAGSLTYCLVHS